MIVRTFRIAGNQRYSWIKNQRSRFVSRTRPRGLPSRPGEFRPEPLTDSGRDTLASSGSCHRTKAAAFRWDLKLLPLTVGSFPTPMTCPLCSAGITPLHRYYEAVRPCPAHRYFRPRGFSACAFSLNITRQVLKFRKRARMRVTPPIHRTSHGQ